MAKLFSNHNFAVMVSSVIFWIVAYVVVKIFTVKAGIGTDLLRQATKRISSFRKITLEFRLLCTEREGSSKTAKQVKLLNRIIKKEKAISKILAMYLFDDKNDLDVAAAKKKIGAVPDICRDIIVQCSEGDTGNLADLFNKMDSNIQEALGLLSKAINLDMKKELLKI